MVEAQGMEKLMLSDPFVDTAILVQWNSLPATCPSNVWPAPAQMEIFLKSVCYAENMLWACYK